MTSLRDLKAKITDTHVFFLRGPLSQWARSVFIEKKGGKQVRFTCCEQYMMYHKALLFSDKRTAELILAETSPAHQKRLGRQVSNFDEKTWADHREKTVFQGNLLKFTQNGNFREMLLATGDRILAEVNPKDAIWGIALSEKDSRIHDKSQWRGLNLLGEALMKVRKAIQEGITDGDE